MEMEFHAMDPRRRFCARAAAPNHVDGQPKRRLKIWYEMQQREQVDSSTYRTFHGAWRGETGDA